MDTMGLHIRRATDKDSELVSRIISKGFRDVAQRFGLTRENCPTHPSFFTPARMSADRVRGVDYWIALLDGLPVGCVAIEQPNETTCYLERLAVLPTARRQGIGRVLVERVLAEAALRGCPEVSIALIAEDGDLQAWYAGHGFAELRTERFSHLPFTVRFMTRRLDEAR